VVDASLVAAMMGGLGKIVIEGVIRVVQGVLPATNTQSAASALTISKGSCWFINFLSNPCSLHCLTLRK